MEIYNMFFDTVKYEHTLMDRTESGNRYTCTIKVDSAKAIGGGFNNSVAIEVMESDYMNTKASYRESCLSGDEACAFIDRRLKEINERFDTNFKMQTIEEMEADDARMEEERKKAEEEWKKMEAMDDVRDDA